MASPTIKRGKRHSSGKSISVAGMSFLGRRCAAWVMEVYLVAISGLVPYSIAVYIESHSSSQRVPLHPVLAKVEEEVAQTLALPQGENPRQVPPLTNVFLGLALAMPLAVTGWQLYILTRTGRTLPKRWLKIRVISTSGRTPSGLQILLREGVGKWGLPLSIAYLLWRYSALFPNGGLLLGLSGVMILLEGGLLLLSPRRRSLHDQIADTVVIDTRHSLRNGSRANRNPQSPNRPSVTVEVPSDYAAYTRDNGNSHHAEPVRAIVLSPSLEEPQANLWLWMRRHPGTTLLVIALAGMTVILATFVGTQVYIQSKTDQRESQQQQNQEFQFLVTQLAATSPDPLEQRKSVILALARNEDPRAIALLVDLLGQETNLSVIDTLQQAFASVGTRALPALRQLNQSLSQQLQSLNDQNSQEYQLTAWRLRATKQAIAKIFLLHNGQLSQVNLTRIDLNQEINEMAPFTLVGEQLNLAGINLENALLNGARLGGSIFSSAGKDKYDDTSDDLRANLRGTNLVQADLTDAFLSGVVLERANLSQANLKGANLSQAQLKQANLSSADLLSANLQQASLEAASLTGANLTGVQLNKANLEKANLGQIKAARADFSEANLIQSNWQNSDLSAVNFSGANLQQTDLSSSFLKGANFRNAKLENANLAYSNLSQADLRGANLAGANFLGVSFFNPETSRSDNFLKAPVNDQSAAIVQGVDFSEVKNLSSSQIVFICQKGGIHPQCNLK
ncbi:pentapeptide repeat-containing protein [Gloeothece verrucosa]|uniref:RDD domain containing protein n=1 Tax=Gloeothece verrucosa (strain PCC 7822) TaxID=497965 RepID=E0UG87_GLOV7|nr:pentapeptide repeat-containing protein [Gloeothece verrucosa]ADN16706.1 RDD domain containing protein [Gloeothece verrucosa PCC 7822]